MKGREGKGREGKGREGKGSEGREISIKKKLMKMCQDVFIYHEGSSMFDVRDVGEAQYMHNKQ